VDELPGKSNYLIGNDPNKWRTNVPTYGRVRYENIYPGVDLVYYGKKGGQLEYDFVVAPGADPGAIRLAIDAERQVSSEQKAVGRRQSLVASRQWSGVAHKGPGTADDVGNSGHVIPQSKIQNRKSKIPRAGPVATDHAPRTTDSTQSKIQNRKSKTSSSLRIAANGDLIVTAEGGEARFHKPVVYQMESIRLRRNSSQSTVKSKVAKKESRQLFPQGGISGELQLPVQTRQRTTNNGQRTSTNPKSKIQNRKLTDGRYVLKSDGEVTFEIAPYDRTRPLIIDPVLSYSTYLGGSDMDYANGIAVDPSGNAYVTGYTASANFPLANPEQNSPGFGACTDSSATFPCFNAFVTKLNPAGTALVYSTYLGGSSEDYGTGIALDASGHAYVTGYTNSTDFPVQNALQAENAGGYDAFVAELSADGASLIYSTYWGGSSDDMGTGVAVDSSGNAHISGYTASPDFPVTPGALQATYGGGGHDGFVVKFNSGGAELGYSTFLGGSADDYAYGVAVDSAGDAYLTGATNSTNFPTVNAFQPNYAGGLCATAPNTFPCYDAFVAKLNPAGSALIYSTYLGGTGSDYGYAIALDGSSNAYVTGYTTSTDFPTTAGAFQQGFGGSYDAFVAKLDSAGSALVYSTYLGGAGTEVGYDVAVDSSGRAFVTGYNYGGDFPTVLPLQAQNAGFYDAFISVLDATGSSLAFSTYFGGSLDEEGHGIALDPSGNAYVTGGTFSLDFPITSGSFQPSYGGGPYDAFVAMVSLVPSPSLSILPSSYKFANQVIGTTSAPQTATLTNVGAAGLVVTDVVASGDFAESDTCVSSSPIPANGTCSVSVTFTPTAPGTRSGALTITDNATIRPQTVILTGTGVGAVASLSPTTLSFGNQVDSTTSAAQTVTLLNTGNTTLNVTGVTIAGTNSSDFAQTNNCGSRLTAGASCTLSVTFTPTLAGSETATLTITDNASPATQTVSLTGTGTAPLVSLSPASLTFPAQAVGTSSSAQTVTLSNTGNVALSVTSITASGDFSQTNTCGASVAAGASCTLSVTFKPTAVGARTGAVTIADNASPATQTVSLTGTGVVAPFVSLSPASLTFSAQAVGATSSAQSVTLTNTGNATLTITSITISGDFSQTNTCGSSLAASASCTLSVTFKPTAAGARTGAATIADNASPTTQTVSLTGTGTGPVVSLSPTSLTFPAQPVNSSSSAQSVTLSNTGNATLTITSITVSGNFSQTNTCGASVAAGASCTLSVTFKPTATGTKTGAVTIADNASPATQTVSLTGTGVNAPTVSLSPASLTFSAQAVGTSGSAQSVTLKNTGSATLSITSIKASGDFSQTNTCGSSVATGTSCTIKVTFKPTAAGTRTGAVTITDNANPATQTVNLTGTGTAPVVSLSPTSLTFAAQAVGTSSSAQSVTLKNTGGATLTITSIKASGDFSQTHTCGSSVATGASCAIKVTFKPTATGTRTGAVTITNNASPATQTVSLTGTGGTAPAVSVSPASLTFPGQGVGTSSNAQSVTLSNTGSAALSIASITASGDASQTNTCGSSVAANANCTLSVTFKPTAAGTRTGAVTIADDAVGSPQTVPLTGTGEDFIFTAPPGSSTSATVSPGGTATYTLSVVALAGFNQNMTFTCAGAPSGARCTASPASVTLSSSSTNVTVTVSTTASSLGMPRHKPLPPVRPARSQPWLLWTMALAALGILAWATQGRVHPGVGRSRASLATFAALLLVMGAMAACGGGGGGGDVPPQGSLGTPPGIYTVTVTGTCSSGSTSLSQSVNLTLQVQ
jgi:hypothetical protein